MSRTHDTEHCLQKCGSGEPCDTRRCPMPERTPTGRKPSQPQLQRLPSENPVVSRMLDSMMTNFEDL